MRQYIKALVQGICDRVMVMHDGVIVEEEPTPQVINCPVNEYTKQLLDSVLEI